jgi:hypothetical protein
MKWNAVATNATHWGNQNQKEKDELTGFRYHPRKH